MKNTVEEINSRLDYEEEKNQQSGRQDSENHPIRKAKRTKKNS